MIKLIDKLDLKRGLKLIIDIHSHILPGIDDGSKNMEETAKILSMAVEEGIQGIVATSHYEAGFDAEWYKKYQDAYRCVDDYIKQHNLQIELYTGNEIYYSESVIDALQNEEACTINGTRYVLVEFPIYADYMYIERALHNLQNAGYWPIIAHVERYETLRDIKRIELLVDMGVCIQVNANSIMNKKNRATRRFCRKLIKNRTVDFIATDTHDSKYRKPVVQLCLAYLDKKVGESYRSLISEENPEKVIKGEKIRG